MEDEEWEDVLVVSFVYPTDSDTGPQNKGTLSAFKRRLKVSYLPLEVEGHLPKRIANKWFRSPSNHLVLITTAVPRLRVFDSKLKPVLLEKKLLGRIDADAEFRISRDFRSVGILYPDDRLKYNLAIYDVEQNAFRSCLEIGTESFEVRLPKKKTKMKMKPFQFLVLHAFTPSEVFLIDESLDYIRIELATGEPKYLFNLGDIDQKSGVHLDLSVPSRSSSLVSIDTPNGKTYAVSVVNNTLSAKIDSQRSYLFMNEIGFAGDQTRVTPTKLYQSDGMVNEGGIAHAKEGFIVINSKTKNESSLMLLKPTPSLSQESFDPRYLRILDVLHDSGPCSPVGTVVFSLWTNRLGGHTFGIFGSGQYKSDKGNQSPLYLRLWVLCRSKFHTHELPISNFKQGWKVAGFEPCISDAGPRKKRTQAQFVITLEGIGPDNSGKKVTLLSTFELRN